MKNDYPFDQAPAIVLGPCGHELAVIRPLQEGQVPVIAFEASLDLPGAQTGLALVHAGEDINGRGLIEALLALRARVHCLNKPVLFLTNDRMSRTLAGRWDVLDPQYFLSWSHSRDQVTALLNKNHLAAHCEKEGLSCPTSRQLHAKSDTRLGLNLSGPVSLELKRDAEGHLCAIEPTIGRTDFWLGLCTVNQVHLPLAEYHRQLGCPQEQRTQRDCALWFNEDRDPGGRLWLALHPSLGLGTRHSSYLYFHKNDIAPAQAFSKGVGALLASANSAPTPLISVVLDVQKG